MLLRGHEATGPHHAERADRSADGALTIEGEIWTNDDIVDYEWEFHVPADQVPRLVTALGGTSGDDVLPSSKPTPTLTSPPRLGRTDEPARGDLHFLQQVRRLTPLLGDGDSRGGRSARSGTCVCGSPSVDLSACCPGT